MLFSATPPIDGAFAEYVVVHAAFAPPVPETTGDDAAALLEPLSVGIWACRKGRVGAGSRVLITGAGPIGLVSVQVARAFGATEIVVSDVNPARLALARDLGATEVVAARPARVPDLPRPPEVLLECSGHPAATGEAIRALDRAGRAVLVGMGGDELPLPLSVVQERELEVTGTFRYAGTWPTAIALVAAGRIDLDLQIADGEFLVLVGPSGCGKSTSLRMLAGLEDVDRGDILIGDRKVTHLKSKDRDIAMVFQSYALYPHMTVADNMGFALKIAGVGKDEIAKRVAEAAKILDLEPFLDRRPKLLSGGQRQRVAMGRAIVRSP